jgi:hypothetical protein
VLIVSMVLALSSGVVARGVAPGYTMQTLGNAGRGKDGRQTGKAAMSTFGGERNAWFQTPPPMSLSDSNPGQLAALASRP